MSHILRSALALAFACGSAAIFAEVSPKILSGRWTSGRLSTIQYRDAYTGVSRPPSGNFFAWEFRPDGAYTFTGLVQNTLYSCTTSLFGEESGTYEVRADGVLTVHPKKNPFKMTNTCAASSNREGPGKLTERSYRVSIEGNRIVLVNLADNLEAVYQRDREGDPTR